MDSKILAAVLLVMAVMAVAFAGCTGTDQPAVKDNGTDVKEEKVTYIVGIDGEYPPYSFIDKDGNAQGFDVESVKWIANEMGFNVKIQPMAWDGIIPALEAGKIDMVYSGMTITPERLDKVNFSKPYWVVNQAVAVKNGSSVTMDDVTEGKVVFGVQRGCTAHDWISRNLVETGKLPEDNLKLYENFPLAVTELENGRVDAVMYDTPVLIDSIKGKDVVKLGTIDTDEEYGIAIRKTDTELLNTMNEGLDKLMADPYWNELIAEYKLE
ncbi:amino acid ABC transporter substrate-binding protein [Methanoplanus sp. FWC-SCC4]|uniref:Amino acid ABC transporter substrate-binding protein n=1 Tax=Methanochimaera problematica TaxID=2609417 RepID=A0AA97FCA3_9EURY|nr:ABC transporter substrate-binding protein [Methanoplanus sp. FWC-SCC4]WOF16840.1 amino acid ABC transporter substrate-binding protein [Methanoplanus sp. FWC-SCC4]